MEWVQSALGSLRSKFAPENPLKTPVQPSAGMKRMNERTSQEHPMLPFARDTMNMVFPGVGNVFSPLTNRALHAMDIQDEVAYEAGARTQDALDFLPSPLPEIAATGVYTAGNVFDPVPGVNPAMVFYHGSPHKFSKFALDKIGTGEGAQAYGHGLYFAESPSVAGTYKKKLTKRGAYSIDGSPVDENTVAHQQLPLQIAAIDGDKGLREFIENYDKRIAGGEKLPIDVLDELDFAESLLGKKVTRAEGSLYTVDIPDEAVDRMLDWDAPLSEQPEVMDALQKAFGMTDETKDYWRSALIDDLAENGPMGYSESRLMDVIDEYINYGEYGEKFGTNVLDELREAAPMLADEFIDVVERQSVGGISPNDTAGSAYKLMAQALGSPDKASRKLAEAGIPGIKYLDGNSRAAGEGTRNVVVFDDSIIKVLSRNGEPVE